MCNPPFSSVLIPFGIIFESNQISCWSVNAEGCCCFVGVNVGVKCRCKFLFSDNSGGNVDVNVGDKCRRHVGNMPERKMLENQYVIVLWEVGYRQ